MAATALPGMPTAGQAAVGDMLALWAEATGRRRAAGHGPGRLRFAFYGRVSTEDWLDPGTSRARQRDQAAALVAHHVPGGRIRGPAAAFRGHPRRLAGAADDLRSPWLRVRRWRLGGDPYRAAQWESPPGGSCPTRCADTPGDLRLSVRWSGYRERGLPNDWPAVATSRQDY